MRVNAAFQGKQLSMEEAPCEVRKVISLPDKEYAFFKKHLMYEYDFLRKNAEQMGFHNGIRQCVLVMGETSEDGVLVDSSGYAYARYTAPFLGARSYMTLREQNLQANGELKNLTEDDLAILHAKHTLWSYGVGGEQADFSHCRIAGLSLGDMQFNGACFRDAVLEDVDLGNAGVCGADFCGAQFVHCRMDGMAAEECDFRNAVFENCTLAQAHLAHSNLTGATMKDCVLCGADLRNCCMEKFSLEDTDLEDAYIQGVMKKEQDWKEDLLYKTLRVQIDREYYCQKADLRFLEDVNLKRPKSMSEFETLWYNGSSRRGVHYDSTRYHALNLHSVFSKGTIEFRMFNSTLHAGEVKSYIQLCLAISHQALIQQRAMRTRTQSENEKYTFRTWLLRLGLIGDEFKTARQHLLKNLDGNIAWKDPAQAIRQRERQMQQRLEQALSSADQSEGVQEVHQQQEDAPAFSMEEQC